MKKRSMYGDLIIDEIICQKELFRNQYNSLPTGIICNMDLFEYMIAAHGVDRLCSWLREIRFITLEDCDKLILKDEAGHFRVFPPPSREVGRPVAGVR